MELYDFTDEHAESERFIEFLSFYTIGKVYLNACVLRLRTTAMYLLGPATYLSANNCVIRFPRADQVCKCTYLKLINTKVNIKINTRFLFGNVIRLFIDNCMMRENLMILFSNKLKQLIVKKTFMQQFSMKVDILHRILVDCASF